MERLKNLGFIKTFDNFQFYKLTDSAIFFKVGLEKEFPILDELQINKKIKLFQILSSLKRKT